ncbi:MAG: DUF4194 domain-containing protein [Methylococcales bacterium]|nr:DUF4194 domain-containing protein [Methylococcales bacterium]
MSHNQSEQQAIFPGISDLFDQFRERQPESPPLVHNPNADSVTAEPLFAGGESMPSTAIDGQSGLSPEGSSSPATPDGGGMPPEARRALVSLLRQGVILAGQKSNLFDTVCRYQDAVRNHLADVYLKLILDQRAGVAFVAGLDESDGVEEETVSLITRRTLSIYDTLLLLVLRKHYQERETAGEQLIMIDIERIEANLSPFLPLTNSTRSDRKKLGAALQKMSEKHILSVVRGSEDRFEITPVIRYVVNAEFLESMLAEYKQLAAGGGLNTALSGAAAEFEQEEKDA